MNKPRFDYMLANVFDDITAGDLFNAIITALGSTDIWSTSDAAMLDTEYLGGVSGNKIISPLVYRLLQIGGTEKLTSGNIATLAQVIVNRYGKQWMKLFNVFSAQYDPIENYSMVEQMTNDVTQTAYGHTNTKTGTETLEAGTATTTNTDIYGYDSAAASPSNKETITNSGNDVTRYNTSDAESGTDTETRNYRLSRSGNIGVTTAQQMIESEIKLWQYDFMKIVYMNIDEVLTIQVY